MKVQIEQKDLEYYQAEVGSMKTLMDAFSFECENFGQATEYYKAAHRLHKHNRLVGIGRIPALAVADWISKVAKWYGE